MGNRDLALPKKRPLMKALRLLLIAGVVAAQFKSKKEERKWKKKQAKLKSSEAVPRKLKKAKKEEIVKKETNETGNFIDTPHGRAQVLAAQTLEDHLGSSAVSYSFLFNYKFSGILLDMQRT